MADKRERKDKISIGKSGEFFAAGELQRHGFTAALTLKNTNDFDILAVSRSDSSQQRCIQVKTTSERKKEWRLGPKNETLTGDNFVYVFVTLNELDAPEYHIVPSEVVAEQITKTHRAWLAAPGKHGQKHNDNNVRKFSDKDDTWLDRWDVLTKKRAK